MIPWRHEIQASQWRTLIAAFLGWMLDGMDVMLYAFALGAIRTEFGLTAAQAGALASVTLIASAFGGTLCGLFADRFGRARALIVSILCYSIFTALTATAHSVAQLVLWRALVGIGLGAEWSAGSVLVAESWPAEHRGKVMGFVQSGWALGYILAALSAAVVLPRFGWRMLFWIGILPACITLWIRRSVPEPAVWKESRRTTKRVPLELLFRPPLRRRLLLATATTTSVLFAYWGVFTWIPTFLAAPIAAGGAGLGLVRSSGWIIPMQIGAFFGYTLFGFGADRWGRRPMFIAYLVAASALVPIYGMLARNAALLLVLGPLVGFFGHGYFSVFGALLSEIFPTSIRGTAQGLAYNGGRALSACAPLAIGAIADRAGFGPALGSTAAFFLLGAGLVLLLPETRGRALDSEVPA
jgi:MFS family permease